MKFVNVATARRLDAAGIAEGTRGEVLMERAGYGAYRFLVEVARPSARRVLVVAGKGNNGGDASVVARYLAESGRAVTLVMACEPSGLGGDAKRNWERLAGSGVRVVVCAEEAVLRGAFAMQHADVIVDGLLGTGVQGAVNGMAAAAIECMNGHGAPVLSLDMPSGLDGDSGEPCGAAVRATWTVTFGQAKRAMLTETGQSYCGRIELIDIGLGREADDGTEPRLSCYAAREIAQMIPPRQMKGHKNTYGHVLVIAGSKGMTGAAVLCAQAALAGGAGLVTVAVPESLLPLVATVMPGCMTLPVPDGGKGMFTHEAASIVFENLPRFDSVAIGPGLGRHKDVDGFLLPLLMAIQCPTVVDADALNHMAEKPELLAEMSAEPVILTPHPGEFERMSGVKPSASTLERAAAAQRFAEEHEVTVLLKGYQSIIAGPGVEPVINLSGNPGMATAGAGDVLTGMLAALLAQGMDAMGAAGAGAFIHGLAGDVAAGEHSQSAVTAMRLIDAIGPAFRYVGVV